MGGRLWASEWNGGVVQNEPVRIRIATSGDVRRLRLSVHEFADRLGLSATDRTVIASVASELARNILLHAGSGDIALEDLQGAGVGIVATDEGPGIDSSTELFPAGHGLSAVRQLMDELLVEPNPSGTGTRVTARKWLRR